MSGRKGMVRHGSPNGAKPRKDWSGVIGRCGDGERARIDAGRARWIVSLMWRFKHQVGWVRDA